MTLQQIHDLFSQALQPQVIGQITRQGYATLETALQQLGVYAKQEQQKQNQSPDTVEVE